VKTTYDSKPPLLSDLNAQGYDNPRQPEQLIVFDVFVSIFFTSTYRLDEKSTAVSTVNLLK